MLNNYRDNWIDCAKAIGILLVVYGHVVRGLIKAGLGVHLHFLNLIDAIIYGFHMPLFFFLSGYLFVQSIKRQKSKKLFRSKIDTILYPYIIWSLIQGLVEVLLNKYTNGGVDISSVLSFLWEPRAHFWFLYALFFIFTFCIFFKNRINKNLSLSFIVAIFVFLFFPVSHIPAIDLSMHYIVFFVFGMVFKNFVKSIYSKNLMMGLCFLVAVFSFVATMNIHTASVGDFYTHLLMFIYSLSCILFVSAFCMSLKDRCSFLVSIGQSSLAVYLIHVIVGSGVRIILNKFLGINNFYVLLIISLFVSIVIPMFIWKLSQKTILQYLFRPPLKVFL